MHAHNGEWTLAQQLARRNIDQFPPEQFDAIITNAGGCGSHLKHYAKLLADDPFYLKAGGALGCKYIHEWLAQIRIHQPSAPHLTPALSLRWERRGKLRAPDSARCYACTSLVI